MFIFFKPGFFQLIKLMPVIFHIGFISVGLRSQSRKLIAKFPEIIIQSPVFFQQFQCACK